MDAIILDEFLSRLEDKSVNEDIKSIIKDILSECTRVHVNDSYYGEVWKDIPGYQGYYQASNFGRIRSVEHTKTFIKHYSDGRDVENTVTYPSRILSQKMSSGYLGVTTSVDGVVSYPLVHRLVALAFLDNPDDRPQVDHIDGDRTNNKPENLRWVTSKENHANAVKHGTHTSQQVYKKKPVRDVDTGRVFSSMLEAELEYGIPRGRISAAIKSGHRVYGHLFEVVESKPKSLF